MLGAAGPRLQNLDAFCTRGRGLQKVQRHNIPSKNTSIEEYHKKRNVPNDITKVST